MHPLYASPKHSHLRHEFRILRRDHRRLTKVRYKAILRNSNYLVFMRIIPTATLASVIVLSMLTVACSDRTGEAVGHTQVSLEGVTYEWPYDGSKEGGDPARWKHYALIPNKFWNGSIGSVTSVKLLPDSGYSPIYLAPLKEKHWNIRLDGSGLPLLGEERFQKTEDHGSFVIGNGVGPGIVSPGTIVIFKGENSAYATCRPPGGPLPKGFCSLLLNDRGVQHTLPFTWGKWLEAPALLKLYRSLIGIPAPS
jgi:hypothetical protein